MPDRESVFDRLAAAKERGARWLVSQQSQAGWSIPLDDLLLFAYKAPWALSTAGRTFEAARLLNVLADHDLSPLGDFFGRTPWGTTEGDYGYRSAWLVCAAHRLARFDLSGRVMDFLIGLQDAQSGGMFSRRDEVGPHGRQEAWITSMFGITALYTGRLEIALRVGRFLARLRAMQPEFERAFYFVYTPAAGLVTKFAPEASAQNVVRVEAGLGDQWYFMPGMASAFLTRLYWATGEAGWLHLAQDYMTFAERCSDEMYDNSRVGKVGWGAALLYHATGAAQYLEIAQRTAEHMVTTQLPDGRWSYELEGWPLLHTEIDFTAEFVGLADEILQGLARPR